MSLTSSKKPVQSFASKEIIYDKENRSGLELNASPLKNFRLEKGLSLRAFAQKVGIETTRILRLERDWKNMTVAELELLSSKAGIQMEDLISNTEKFDQEMFYRASLDKPVFTFEPEEGVKISSFRKSSEPCFIGTLRLEPQKTFSFSQAPKGESLFLLILEGTLHLKLFRRELVLKKGNYFSTDKPIDYEFYNPHQFEPLVSFLFTRPSFIHVS